MSTKRIAGDGFSVRVPSDWQVRRLGRLVEARQGSSLVSVAVTALPRPFRPALWAAAIPELDRTAQQFAAQTNTSVKSSATTRIDGRQGRVYTLASDRRLGFLLVERNNYTLYCRNAGSACDSLFASFKVSTGSSS